MSLGPDTVSVTGDDPMYASNFGSYVSPTLNANVVRAGAVLSDTAVSNSTRIAGASIAGATTANIIDFADPAYAGTFPPNSAVSVQWSDGTQAPGGGVGGLAYFSLVGAGKVVTFGQQGWWGSETGVTGCLVNGVGSVLNITITGKTTTTSGIFLLTRLL
jgi:hypothetical protein